MPTMEDLDPSILFALFKGEPGTRKSTAALSFPKPQYWVSVDKKMESLYLPMKRWGVNPKDILYDDFKDYNSVEKKLEEIQTTGRLKDGRKIETLVLDSVTSLGDVINIQTREAKGSGVKRKSGEEAGREIAGIAVNELEDYNAEAAAFQTLMAICKDIKGHFKMNVIWIAHVIQVENKSQDGRTHFSRSLVTGGKKAAAKIPAYCTEIYHFNLKTALDASKGENYGLWTRHTGDDYARTSLPLDAEILFGNDELYSKYLAPGIKRLKEMGGLHG